MLDAKDLQIGNHVLRGDNDDVVKSAVIDELVDDSDGYFGVRSTDKRFIEENPVEIGRAGSSLLPWSPRTFAIPVEALRGEMTPDQLRHYLEASPDYSPADFPKANVPPKETLIGEIIVQLNDIVANYVPLDRVVERILKYRSVRITNEDFHRDRPKAVEWKNLRLEQYIACHKHPDSEKLDPISRAEGLYAHDAIVEKIDPGRIKIYNPGRDELTDCFPNSFRVYGTSWFLIRPSDYTGPKE